MATTNNLGRVQGISLWVADGVVTTTGTITLTNSTMHPLINDNVIDTNGNVFKITAVSGTNPYTITTSGTPIYQIKGGDGEWDDEIFVGPLEPQQVVSDDIASRLQTFLNLITNGNQLYIETCINVNHTRYSSVSSNDIFTNTLYIEGNGSGNFNNATIEWSFYTNTTSNCTYSPANKYFRFANEEYTHLKFMLLRYKNYGQPSATSALKFNLEDLNALLIQDSDGGYQFNNDDFKNNLVKEPNLIFLTINGHEFRGFFLEDNLYKHIDNEYQLNEETNEQELVKTYTCTIDLTNNLITYNENDIINITKEEEKTE